MQPLEAAELIDERPDERLDTARLEPYLHAHLEGAEGPLSVQQFGGGKANLTYLIRFGSNEFVLRRPPLGPIPPGAHDMRREHRVLSVLHRRYRPAPRSRFYARTKASSARCSSSRSGATGSSSATTSRRNSPVGRSSTGASARH